MSIVNRQNPGLGGGESEKPGKNVILTFNSFTKRAQRLFNTSYSKVTLLSVKKRALT
jgi:hypothetical protein